MRNADIGVAEPPDLFGREMYAVCQPAARTEPTALIKVALGVIMIWLIVRPGFKGDRSWLLVKYSLPAKIFVLVMFVFFVILLNSAIQAEKGPVMAVYIVLTGLVVLAILGVLEVFRCKLWFDNTKIYYQSPYGHRKVINIEDITDCRLAWFGNVYLIKSTQGEKIGISPLMSGGTEFFELIRQYLAEKT